MEIRASSTEDTKKLAESLAGELKPGSVIALHGDLGAGKTTFTGYLVKSLGFESRVQSPTFVIVRKYSGNTTGGGIQQVYHIDLYRLTDPAELDDLGLSDLLAEKNAIFVIEWPEVAEEILPEDTIHIYFEYMGDDGRLINVQNLS